MLHQENGLKALFKGFCGYSGSPNESLIERGLQIPIFSLEEAADIFAALTKKYDFALFEYFQTDLIGHRKDVDQAVAILEWLDQFFGRLAARFCPKKDALIIVSGHIVSDHGNIEDTSVRTHTTNPNPLLPVGERTVRHRHKMERITEVKALVEQLLIKKKWSESAMNQSFELLAPAGTWDAFIAAVKNGADAVYLGGKMFSARSYAGNFSDEELKAAVSYAHKKGVKIYVTVNTLISDDELKEALEYVIYLDEIDVDAIILQDIGLARLIRSHRPSLSVHASTQMTVHNAETAAFLEDWGFSRIIAERQMSKQETAELINKTDLEIEVFAHGALCVSYSGQCLMSSLISARSGNRGKCTQPCRMEYTCYDVSSNKTLFKEGLFPLSTKDLNLSERIPELIDMGVRGIKIEGRMKQAEYVAVVIRIYRNLIDRYFKDPSTFRVLAEEKRKLDQIFNRGFTEGCLFASESEQLMSLQRPNHRGAYIGRVAEVEEEKRKIIIKLDEKISLGDEIEIWVTRGGRIKVLVERIEVLSQRRDDAHPGEEVAVFAEGQAKKGDRVFRTFDKALMEEAKASFSSAEDEKKTPLSAEVYMSQKEPFQLVLQDPDGNKVMAASEKKAEAAKKHDTDRAIIGKQLDRMGNTPFTIKEVSWNIEEGTFIPISIINEVRRQAVKQLVKRHQQKRKSISSEKMKGFLYTGQEGEELADKSRGKRNAFCDLAISVDNKEGAVAAIKSGVDVLYWGGDLLSLNEILKTDQWEDVAELARQNNISLAVALPRITKQIDHEKMTLLFKRGAKRKQTGIRLGNLGAAEVLKNKNKWGLIADYPLNLFNSSSLSFFYERGFQKVVLSPELTLNQIKKLHRPHDMKIECIVHGQLPVMISEYCPFKNKKTACVRSGSSSSCLYKNKKVVLQDKAGYNFPVQMDAQCRMILFNSKELCLYSHLEEFTETGIDSLRIEAVGRSAAYIGKVVSLYRHVLDSYKKGTPLNGDELKKNKDILEKLSAGGITRGHYFRGVE